MTKDEKQQLGNFLKEVRELIGLDIKEMAKYFFVHRTQYSKWERGICTPNEDHYLIKETAKYVLNEYMKKKNREWERLMNV